MAFFLHILFNLPYYHFGFRVTGRTLFVCLFVFNSSTDSRSGREVVSELSENRPIDKRVGPAGVGI